MYIHKHIQLHLIFYNIAAKTNHLQYGSCPVGESSHLTYTLTNYSSTDPIRFQWPTVDSLTFSPALGHLHPCSSKDIVTTFTSNKPKSCKNQKFAGKFWKIAYSKPIKEVCTVWCTEIDR